MAQQTSTRDDVMILREFGDPAGDFRAVMWTRKVSVPNRDEDGKTLFDGNGNATFTEQDHYAVAYMFEGEKRKSTSYKTDASAARRAFYAVTDTYLDAHNLENEVEAEESALSE
jgi:hypothetical protein